ncbi:MAG: hypothetical protein IJ832_01365 [Bacteroidaceae bacterium]|nr:hypothetical protein [Bacteroidaceae bacterium]
MKKVILFIMSAVMFSSIGAQKINIGVVVPDNAIDGVASSVFSSLSTKLERMITNCGGTSVNNGNIVLYPEFNFVNDDMIEGGMRNIYSVNVEMTVKAVSLRSNNNFGAVSWTLKGKGYSKSEAVKDGLGKLNTDDPKFGHFYNDIKTKIEKYYVANRAAIMTRAKSLAAQQQYEEAIALLYDYPAGISGSSEVLSLLTSVYRKYQTANCSRALQEARAKFAVQEYDEAASIIADIDATSSCANEVKALSEQIRNKINADQVAEQEMEMRKYEADASVERARWKAIGRVASAYYYRWYVPYNTIVARRWYYY